MIISTIAIFTIVNIDEELFRWCYFGKMVRRGRIKSESAIKRANYQIVIVIEKFDIQNRIGNSLGLQVVAIFLYHL